MHIPKAHSRIERVSDDPSVMISFIVTQSFKVDMPKNLQTGQQPSDHWRRNCDAF
jgi:hypothetical protein